ncbi:hypothetical protein M0804_013677 [Polistes exclamans]|nr:hypothetical protein M0804_013677 [Polistes exclamans]
MKYFVYSFANSTFNFYFTINTTCSRCNYRVAKPIICNLCGIAAHPNCLSRTGHSFNIGRFLSCKRNVESRSSNISNISNSSSSAITSLRDLGKNWTSTNSILFNVNENIASTSSAPPLSDDNIVKDIIKKIDPSVHLGSRTRRIGKRSSDRSRPIRVTLNSKKEVISILKNKSKYSGPVVIAQDRTKAQRDYLKAIKFKLKARTDDGNQNFTIKYNNGTPKIFNSETNRKKIDFTFNKIEKDLMSRVLIFIKKSFNELSTWLSNRKVWDLEKTFVKIEMKMSLELSFK